MKSEIESVFVEGDSLLKEAKTMFYKNEEGQSEAVCVACRAMKKYLDAYELFLFESIKPSENFHLLLHTIIQRDNEFDKFNEKIFKVKCFLEESKKEAVTFFLYPEEVNDVLKTIIEIRNYVGLKTGLNEQFMGMSKIFSDILAI